MRIQHQWWNVLVVAVLGGLASAAVVAAGEQFLPVLSTREGALRALQIPLANGFIDYVTLLNARDGGINGVPLVWEECETVNDITRGVECYERLKAKGPTGAAVRSKRASIRSASSRRSNTPRAMTQMGRSLTKGANTVSNNILVTSRQAASQATRGNNLQNMDRC